MHLSSLFLFLRSYRKSPTLLLHQHTKSCRVWNYFRVHSCLNSRKQPYSSDGRPTLGIGIDFVALFSSVNRSAARGEASPNASPLPTYLPTYFFSALSLWSRPPKQSYNIHDNQKRRRASSWNAANRGQCNVCTCQLRFAAGMDSDHLSLILFLDTWVLKGWVVKQKDGGAGEAGIGIDVVFNVIFVTATISPVYMLMCST